VSAAPTFTAGDFARLSRGHSAGETRELLSGFLEAGVLERQGRRYRLTERGRELAGELVSWGGPPRQTRSNSSQATSSRSSCASQARQTGSAASAAGIGSLQDGQRCIPGSVGLREDAWRG
jgi:hypothetical protein